ncbi:hypothetical protein K2173_023715 [Erythroxylum novogranatense]|uniref:GDSL esterase/lipase n=1 Tax=Erythroxylum novogranatense TaxID=1862640 RepID=A0AAV8TQT3_9ROSI|nr:hypothetical protein K2173_023715 [Erythroxylum novogranatense]
MHIFMSRNIKFLKIDNNYYMKMKNTIPSLILLLLSSALSYGIRNSRNPNASPKFSAILIFGDSTVDSGNNNYINTLFKADFYPYGQDFPGHISSGRFSNGKLVPDFIASKLGIKDTVPAFLDPKLAEKELLTGVSFASAGSGYDDVTSLAPNVIPFPKQVEMFKNYTSRLKGVIGEKEAANIIGDALLYVSAGTNDWIFSFYDLPTRRLEFDVHGYQDFLQNRITSFIKELYDLGCRTFIVNGLPPIGCLPIQIQAKLRNPKMSAGCLEDQNSDSQLYNTKLEKLLPQLQANLPGSEILYGDIYNSPLDMINNPKKYDFVDTKKSCCGGTELGLSFICEPKAPKCRNTSQFLFWDAIHPTQVVYEYLAKFLVEKHLSQVMY